MCQPVSWISCMADWFQVPAVSTATGKRCESQRARHTLQSCSLLPPLQLSMLLWQSDLCTTQHRCQELWRPMPWACLIIVVIIIIVIIITNTAVLLRWQLTALQRPLIVMHDLFNKSVLDLSWSVTALCFLKSFRFFHVVPVKSSRIRLLVGHRAGGAPLCWWGTTVQQPWSSCSHWYDFYHQAV